MIFFAEGESNELYDPKKDSQESQNSKDLQESQNALNIQKQTLSTAVEKTCQNTCDSLKNTINQQEATISKCVRQNNICKKNIADAKLQNPGAFEKALSTVKGMWDSVSAKDIIEIHPEQQEKIIDSIKEEYSTIGEPIMWDAATSSFVPDDSFGSASGEQRQMASLANNALLRMLRESKIEKILPKNNTSSAGATSKGTTGSSQNQNSGSEGNASDNDDMGVYAPPDIPQNDNLSSDEVQNAPEASADIPNSNPPLIMEDLLNSENTASKELIHFLEEIKDDTNLKEHAKKYMQKNNISQDDTSLIVDEDSLSIDFKENYDDGIKTFFIEKTDNGIVAGVRFMTSDNIKMEISLPLKDFIKNIEQIEKNPFPSEYTSIIDLIKNKGERQTISEEENE